MKKLLKNKSFVLTLSVVGLVFAGLIIAWQSALYTLNHMNFKEVTPTLMATAMRQDDFWSTNRFNTLVFNGKVKSLNKVGSKTTLLFVTSDTYSASCMLNNTNTDIKVGESYKFAAETYQAERQPNGVLLHNCILLSS